MVLSCFDLVAVITNYSRLLFYLMSWLSEDYHLSLKIKSIVNFFTASLSFSLYVLLVMSIERYLGTYYPNRHRTSANRRRLLTLLAILLIFHTTLYVISTNDFIIPRALVIPISTHNSFILGTDVSQLQTVQNFERSTKNHPTKEQK